MRGYGSVYLGAKLGHIKYNAPLRAVNFIEKCFSFVLQLSLDLSKIWIRWCWDIKQVKCFTCHASSNVALCFFTSYISEGLQNVMIYNFWGQTSFSNFELIRLLFFFFFLLLFAQSFSCLHQNWCRLSLDETSQATAIGFFVFNNILQKLNLLVKMSKRDWLYHYNLGIVYFFILH